MIEDELIEKFIELFFKGLFWIRSSSPSRMAGFYSSLSREAPAVSVIADFVYSGLLSARCTICVLQKDILFLWNEILCFGSDIKVVRLCSMPYFLNKSLPTFKKLSFYVRVRFAYLRVLILSGSSAASSVKPEETGIDYPTVPWMSPEDLKRFKEMYPEEYQDFIRSKGRSGWYGRASKHDPVTPPGWAAEQYKEARRAWETEPYFPQRFDLLQKKPRHIFLNDRINYDIRAFRRPPVGGPRGIDPALAPTTRFEPALQSIHWYQQDRKTMHKDPVDSIGFFHFDYFPSIVETKINPMLKASGRPISPFSPAFDRRPKNLREPDQTVAQFFRPKDPTPRHLVTDNEKLEWLLDDVRLRGYYRRPARYHYQQLGDLWHEPITDSPLDKYRRPPFTMLYYDPKFTLPYHLQSSQLAWGLGYKTRLYRFVPPYGASDEQVKTQSERQEKLLRYMYRQYDRAFKKSPESASSIVDRWTGRTNEFIYKGVRDDEIRNGPWGILANHPASPTVADPVAYKIGDRMPWFSRSGVPHERSVLVSMSDSLMAVDYLTLENSFRSRFTEMPRSDFIPDWSLLANPHFAKENQDLFFKWPDAMFRRGGSGMRGLRKEFVPIWVQSPSKDYRYWIFTPGGEPTEGLQGVHELMKVESGIADELRRNKIVLPRKDSFLAKLYRPLFAKFGYPVPWPRFLGQSRPAGRFEETELKNSARFFKVFPEVDLFIESLRITSTVSRALFHAYKGSISDTTAVLATHGGIAVLVGGWFSISVWFIFFIGVGFLFTTLILRQRTSVLDLVVFVELIGLSLVCLFALIGLAWFDPQGQIMALFLLILIGLEFSLFLSFIVKPPVDK